MMATSKDRNPPFCGIPARVGVVVSQGARIPYSPHGPRGRLSRKRGGAMTISEAGQGLPRAIEADDDPIETREWLDSIDAVVRYRGPERALFLLQKLETRLRDQGVSALQPPYSAYRNTIPLEKQGAYPGDLAVEQRLTSIIRWNALAMVMRANRASGELGGHLASYASAAEIFETGFNHFFRGVGEGFAGDLVFFQPHSAPGVYARAFLEGRLSEDELARYRQEVGGGGLSSYPHPWLMPDFWQFPTGSMGLGVINAIYQARFMRYLEHRGLMGASDRRVWGVYGDGELDEPEFDGRADAGGARKTRQLDLRRQLQPSAT